MRKRKLIDGHHHTTHQFKYGDDDPKQRGIWVPEGVGVGVNERRNRILFGFNGKDVGRARVVVKNWNPPCVKKKY